MPMEDSKRKKRPIGRGRLGALSEQSEKSGNRVQIDAIAPEAIGVAVTAVVLAGGAIFFGATADGGAVKISVYDDTEQVKWFIHSSEDLEWTLRSLYETYKG